MPAARALLLLLAALPAAAQDPPELDKACRNETRLLCSGNAGAALKVCLAKFRRSLLPPCRAALEGKPYAPPEPAPAETKAPPAPPAATAAVSSPAVSALPIEERSKKALGNFMNVDLPRSDGAASVWLGGCDTPKCLTVFLAPWCGYCRAATPAIKDLRTYLAGRGVGTRIIIGKDKPQALKEYADEFGPETLLDVDGDFRFSGGVPHFFVSRDGGEILLGRAGLHSDASPEKAAARFKLP